MDFFFLTLAQVKNKMRPFFTIRNYSEEDSNTSWKFSRHKKLGKSFFSKKSKSKKFVSNTSHFKKNSSNCSFSKVLSLFNKRVEDPLRCIKYFIKSVPSNNGGLWNEAQKLRDERDEIPKFNALAIYSAHNNKLSQSTRFWYITILKQSKLFNKMKY